ncbi:MAG: hypothetical protein ACLQBY_14775 [Solirubrobacteraceae bacterium]
MSAGILSAVAPSSIEAMLHGAEAALYEAKRTGRDRTVISGRQARARAHVVG